MQSKMMKNMRNLHGQHGLFDLQGLDEFFHVASLCFLRLIALLQLHPFVA